MTEQATVTPVRKVVTVAASQERAFAVFTEGLATWWPKTHHIGAEAPENTVIEPRVDGRWYERAPDGAECDWGRVRAWEPPERILLAWHLDASWTYDPDPEHASEVEVRFISETADRTRVELEHRGLERHGEDTDTVRQRISSDNGWPLVMDRYAEVASV